MAKKIKRPDKVTLNIQIPRDLHDRFKAWAIGQGEPMRFFVQQDIKKRIGEKMETATLINPATGERKEIVISELQKARTQGVEL